MSALSGCLILGFALSAHAYIGPGVGVTLIGWFVGCSVAVAAALGAVVMWPVRRVLAKIRRRRDAPRQERKAEGGDEE
jgi:uncharacterized iron-regulated membrane protein